MTKMDRQAEDREALERLLDIYGADRTRWPARERLRFASVISEDKAAARHAGGSRRARPAAGTGAARERRRHRGAEGAHHGRGSCDRGRRNLLSSPPASRPVASVHRLPARRRSIAARFGRGQWPAAAMLAASLVLGVMLGSAGTFDATVQEMAQVTGLSSTASDSSQLALGEEIEGQPDEDLL